MDGLTIRSYQPQDCAEVVRLWRDCNLVTPQNDPDLDIGRKLAFQPDFFLVVLLDDRIVATVMMGYDGHRGYINYLAVAPDCRAKGIGRFLMREAEARLDALGCPKINLLVRNSNAGVVGFYRKLGFIVDEVVSMGKRLSPE